MRVISIGNFDGVHLGHQGIAAQAMAIAGDAGIATAVTFEPLPTAILRPGHAPARLTTSAQRRNLLQAAGFAHVLELEPTPELLRQSPQEFVSGLRQHHPFDAVVEGADFRFGHARSGTMQTMAQLGQEHGFQIVVAKEVEAQLSDFTVVAPRSTTIRWLLELGRVHDARLLLGRPYQVEGSVERGDQRGRLLGFPTANVNCAGQQLPGDGVYAGFALTPHGRYAAAVSVGTKPTFQGSMRACEAHLLGFQYALDHYGWPIHVEFTRWLRDQSRFSSAASLVEQMHRDVAQCA
jgi:riboflavin kinase/FMN adenylyltransferase